ncbi:hypothetical protein [Clostridium estertheticum]|uniref:Uncharacterized protein n=1 Tax=Clostridium estertheticum subsp. estertheticum TaxID=1552 RepID=A0A1J0GJJ3_9CLOT|nr:hypothetical protein [Clostridium estertheticum]APC41532.1 hypothetical protein A7L45_16335 [Clostridium estertheticum subsp. estertheticum]
MGLFSKKDNDGNIEMAAKHTSGLEAMYLKDIMIYATWNESKRSIIFKNKTYTKKQIEQTVNLSIDKIKRIGIISEKEIIEHNKSVGGRAVAGGLLLGPLGLLVGGMSGIGKNKTTKIKMFMIINYDEDRVITLELPLIPINSNKLTLAVRAHLNLPNEITL